MKRLSLFTGLFLLIFTVLNLFGHPASKCELQFDQQESILSIHIIHNTKSITEHFIHKIEIALNKKVLVKQEFLSQADDQGTSLVYRLHDVKEGDEIEVTVHCNVFGKKKETLSIPKSN